MNSCPHTVDKMAESPTEYFPLTQTEFMHGKPSGFLFILRVQLDSADEGRIWDLKSKFHPVSGFFTYKYRA